MSNASQKIKSGVSRVSSTVISPIYALLRNKLKLTKFLASVVVVYLLMPGVVLDFPPTYSWTEVAPLGVSRWFVLNPQGSLNSNNLSALVHAFLIVTVVTSVLSLRS